MNQARRFPESLWNELLGLDGTDHRHLDEVVDSPPAPGETEWTEVISSLIEWLRSRGGDWVVNFPVGMVDSPPSKSQTVNTIIGLADTSALLEPPSVYPMPSGDVPNLWQGEQHSWLRCLNPNVVEEVCVSRSTEEADRGDAFYASVYFKVWSANS